MIEVVRQINEEGENLIKDFEGFHATPYLCPAKIWTIGYGHTSTVRLDMVVTREQAQDLLDADLRLTERGVSRLVTVDLNDNQFAALVSFAFNVGLGNFENSTLLKLLNRGWYQMVPAQLARWNHVDGEVMPGLTRRRTAEGALWSKPIGESNVATV